MHDRRVYLGLLIAGMLMSLMGCSSTPPPRLNYYASPDLPRVSRVVFVELVDDVGYPRIAQRMTNALQEALLQKGMFKVDIIPATHPDLRDLDMSKRDPYTLAELAKIRKSLRCDAILFGRMVSYKPYPSTQIGLFLRVIDLKDGQLTWAIDDIWDSTDRVTVQQIKNFYFDNMRDTYQPANSEIGIMSTDGFQKFVSYQIVETMDPKYKDRPRSRDYFDRPVREFGRNQEHFWRNVREDL